MSDRQSGMFTPALIGGAVAGILSALPFMSCLCCLWILGGAALAAYLYAKDAPGPVTTGDGAVVGALAGVMAAVIDAFIGIPMRGVNLAVMKRMLERLSDFTKDMPADWQTWLERSSGRTSIAMFFLGLLISAAIFAAFGALGGVIGTSLFGKKPPRDSSQGQINVPQNTGDRQS
jgi:hypothetical protein